MSKGILNIFGDMIQYLEINFRGMNVIDGREIIKAMNDNSSLSLKRLELMHCEGNEFDDLKSSFPYLNSLRFSTRNPKHKFKVIDNQMKWSQIFSNVTDLHLEYTRAADWTFIDGHFPNMTLLEAGNVLR